MPEAVIVATGRTPIGRANKGSLVECRPDDLSALVLRAVLEKVPQLVFVSATPGAWELRQSTRVAEQLIRPTFLVDPEVELRPTTTARW